MGCQDWRVRELPLSLPLRRRGIAQSSLQKRHQIRRERVRRHAIFHNLAPLPEYSADIRVPPRQQITAQSGFFRSHLLVVCAAKPATRQPLHVSIGVCSPRVCPQSKQRSRPRCTRHDRCSLRCASAASSWPAPASKVRCARCSLANTRPPSSTTDRETSARTAGHLQT